ncbi:hypothetical protein JTE90_003546 [Oedothorax gibbosus]|uniref:Uncharacterized protein n=1 Tax=Oedothorax gibbosus TaxID=931172 RepID=A0AAV6VIG8_9ARAC|nr:hypothetical protein JTE90_003546 [Oedothorax gibbosus]
MGKSIARTRKRKFKGNVYTKEKTATTASAIKLGVKKVVDPDTKQPGELAVNFKTEFPRTNKAMKAGLQPNKSVECFETPPPVRRFPREAFHSPTTSASSNCDLERGVFHSFRASGRIKNVTAGRRKNILQMSDDDEAAPDSVFGSPAPGEEKPELK